MATLSGLEALQSLTLNNTRVADAGLGHLAKLKALHTLNMFNIRVTDVGLAHLSAMTVASLRRKILEEQIKTDFAHPRATELIDELVTGRVAVDPTLVVGAEVFCQQWSRDAASPSATSLSNALRFLVNP